MAYQRFEIREWVYLKLSETSPKTTYRATSWNEVFDETSLEAVSIDTKKLAWLIFNKYHIQVEPVALKKFTVNQLIDYITSNVDYIASDSPSSRFSNTETNDSYDIHLVKIDKNNLTSSDITKWVKNIIAKDRLKSYSAISYNDPVVIEGGMTSFDWEWRIYEELNIQIRGEKIKKMNVGGLIDTIVKNKDTAKNKIVQSARLSHITFGDRNQSKTDIFYRDIIAQKAIASIRKREKYVIRHFILGLLLFLLPLYFVGPNIIKSGIVFSSMYEWFTGIICFLGIFIVISIVKSGLKPFKRCRIAFSEENKRLFSHYTLMLFFVLTSSMSLYASQSINLSNVAGENISSSSYSIEQSNSEEESIRDNLKVIMPIDDENRVTAILIVLAVAIAFNITICTLFKKIVKKFTKMEMDGVILERNVQPQTTLSFWENGDISLNKDEKKKMLAIKIKVTKQLFFYHVLFTILILSTAYFAIIRPIIEIGK